MSGLPPLEYTCVTLRVMPELRETGIVLVVGGREPRV